MGAFEDSAFSDEQLKGEKEAEKRRLVVAERLYIRRFQGQGKAQQIAALAALLKAIDTPLSGRSVITALEFSLDMTPINPAWEEAKQKAAKFNATSMASLDRLVAHDSPCICFADGEEWEELAGHDWKLTDSNSYCCSNCGAYERGGKNRQ